MARAFLENGAQIFIGPNDYPDGDVALLFEIAFVHEFLKSQGNARAAFDKASRGVEGAAMFQLFDQP